MSRCFPFPPPGYDKTTRTHRLDLLDKDKHKEKKHKKEKKDKEKREGKEKKDKGRSEDKHKDRKDRKEKHKDKKKEKDTHQEKSRASEERTEHEGLGEGYRKSQEIKDSKVKEELVRRIQDEKEAASRPVETSRSSIPRSHEGFHSAPKLEKERVKVIKMPPNSANTTQRNEGLGRQIYNVIQGEKGVGNQPAEYFNSSAQRGPESSSVALSKDKESTSVTKILPNSINSTKSITVPPQRIDNVSILVQRRTDDPNSETALQKDTVIDVKFPPNPVHAMHKENGRVSRPLEIPPTSVQRFDAPKSTAAVPGMERATSKKPVASPSITIRRPNGIGRPMETISISTRRKSEAGGVVPATVQGSKLLPDGISSEQKQSNSTPPFIENIADGRVERMEKVKDGTCDDGKREKNRSSDWHEKKRKEKDKHKKKKKEKETKKEKGEHNNKGHDELRESDKKNQIDSIDIRPLALPSGDGKTAQAEENSKKRKDHEMNGFVQHHDVRPTKFSRIDVSNIPEENGSASHMAAALFSSIKPDALNIVKAERVRDGKEDKISGKPEAHRSGADSRLLNSIEGIENGRARAKSPHPDSRYLSQIYAVPESVQLPEHDDQEWLFDRDCSLQKRKSGLEVDATPQVWSEALTIESADVIALPYVIPF